MKGSTLRAAFIAVCLASLTIPGCGDGKKEAAYKAACEGPPLRTVQRHEQAMQDGYVINKTFDCIDKASFEAIKQQKADWAAANTPEAKAKREADHAKLVAEGEAQRAAADRQAAEAAAAAKPAAPLVIRPTDVNTATEGELADIVGVGREGAAQIVAERTKGPFKEWADLVNRVIAVHSAQNAFYASVGGLTVDGQSLPGAPPNAAMAAALQKK